VLDGYELSILMNILANTSPGGQHCY